MNKSAAILCPGPSLARHKTSLFAAYDMTLAVNRAIHYYMADYWCFQDIHVWHDFRPAFIPSWIWTTANVVAKIKKAGFDLTGYRFKLFEDADMPTRNQWRLFTMNAAIVCAAENGATNIGIYGSDWTPGPDFDGHADGRSNRVDTRWEREQVIYQRVTEALAGVGVSIVRVP